MELINLGNNAIGDQGAFAFSKCLDKIGELWLKDCGVTEIGVKQMTKMHSQMADRVSCFTCIFYISQRMKYTEAKME